ncbi:proteasome adapter and scaffold protein ECM29-like [Asterias rubens]|uniref:proteasome adapter and scaffold protein ECM29-like n=1 Tax=Asterias rubens TaxID=7604 RepID=UPI0014554119|nr:proteasome adapter and scaffold protein ECM29-like [Asterias rubens]
MAAQDELELLERVFLRVGSAETDEQLQNVTSRFLPPVLLKLCSNQEGVRKKVLELLVHINKRLKSRPKVQIPVDVLLLQYQDPANVTFVTNFTILYLKMGYPRLSLEKQAELAPSLIQCIEGKPILQQECLLQMLIPTLPHLKLPKDPVQRKVVFGLSEKPITVQMLLDFMLDYLLLPYTFSTSKAEERPTTATGGQQTASSSSSRPTTAPAGGAGAAAATASGWTTPPGLSATALKRVLGEGVLEASTIEECKVGIVNFLAADVLSEEDVVCHLIVACSDTRYSVATAADIELRKMQGVVNWNNIAIVNKLYSLFKGTVVIKGQPAIKQDDRRLPVSTRVRLKIFPFFLKSREAAEQFPACIQVIFDCLYGNNTNAKLKTFAVQFVHHLCDTCSTSRMQPMGPILLSGMGKLISEAKDSAQLRGLAYVAVGKLSRRLPQLSNKFDMALLQQFFDALSTEDANIRMHVQESLSMMAQAFRNLEGPNVQIMQSLIMSNIEKSEPQARLVAVQYASIVFPGNHIASRYALLLASGDEKEDIQNEAVKGLRIPSEESLREQSDDASEEPMSGASNSKALVPAFPEMVLYISEMASKRVKSSSRYVSGNTHMPFKPSTFNQVILYLRSCLLYDAGIHVNPEALFDLGPKAPMASRHVNQLLNQSGMSIASPLLVYIRLIQELLNTVASCDVMKCLLEVVAIATGRLAKQFEDKLTWIKNFVNGNREDLRTSAAQLYGIVCDACSTETLIENIKECSKIVKDQSQVQSFEYKHGCLLGLGFIVGRYLSRDKRQDEAMITGRVSGKSKDKAVVQLHIAIEEAVKIIASSLDNTNPLLSTAACIAIGEITRNGALPLPDGDTVQQSAAANGMDDTKEDKKGKSASKDGPFTKRLVVQKLVEKLQSSKVATKVKEQAASCLGHLPIGERDFPFTQDVLEGLLKSASIKEVELHFSVGNALSHAALGPASPVSRDIWTQEQNNGTEAVQSPEGASGERRDWLEWLLTRILQEEVTNQNPHRRQAVCIWLLSIVQQCGSSLATQKRMQDIQQAFVNFLSEREELTQDVASKGLSLVYEQSTPDRRTALVSVLVEALMTGKRAKQTVTEDTKLFSDGSLGSNPSGGSLSTYKELCSLASDLNQPDLIYKFMHLANHNAMWNSRKGAAFGFSSIAAHAGDQLAPYLPKLVPRLYRYQYDPSGPVRQAMSSIWSALVKDNKNVVDTYLKEIVEDLLHHLTHHAWRNRESSCLALSDLLRGRNVDGIVDFMPALWESCLKVLDDIKESVRKSAEAACRSLSKVCIKMCDLQYGKVGEQALALVLPCLLEHGLPSRVEEVRNISLYTLVQISKKAGSRLKPHMAVLVTAQLESLSGLEHQAMNYMSLHVGQNQDSQEKLDNARIAVSKSSPMMEMINMCAQYVDSEVLVELVPRVCDLIRSGIGMGTKAGCANFLILLSHQCPLDLAPFAGKLLSALLTGLNDKSLAVRKTNAAAIGHLIKVAKDSSVEKLITKLKNWYTEKDDEALHTACGLTLQAMSRHSSDAFKRHNALAMPLVFLAMHATKEKVSGRNEEKDCVWEEVWLDSTPGTEGGIKLYLAEIVTQTKEALGSQSWPRKAQAARAMSTVAKKLGSRLQPPHLGRLLAALVAGLSGRTWNGKDELLRSISTVCTSCRNALESPDDAYPEQPTIETVLTAVFRESKKERIDYKIVALQCLSSILQAHNIDRFKDVTDILFPLLSKEKKDDSDSDDENDRERQDAKLKLQECAYESLGKAWLRERLTQDLYHQEFCRYLSDGLQNSTFKVQVTILKSLGLFLDRLMFLVPDISDIDCKFVSSILLRIIPDLCKCLGIVKYIAIRREALNILEKLVTKLKEINQFVLLNEEMLETLHDALIGMSTDTDLSLKDRSRQLRKRLEQYSQEDEEENSMS